MEDLIQFLDNNKIKYSTQRNKHNELVIDFLSYEIIKEDDGFCIANINNMNLMFMSLPEIEEWILGNN